MKKSVNIYIDWFNLYYAIQKKIKDSSSWWRKEFQRCDFHKLFSHFLKEDEEINTIYFFSAYRVWDQWVIDRHIAYISALSNHNIRPILWKYLSKTNTYTKGKNPIEAILCDKTIESPLAYIDLLTSLSYWTYEEKETDVKIALQIVEDAFLGKYDHAYIISWDSDITPAIETVRKLVKQWVISSKLFSSILVPGTKGKKIRKLCNYQYDITTKQMIDSVLPHNIIIDNTTTISIPKEWL